MTPATCARCHHGAFDHVRGDVVTCMTCGMGPSQHIAGRACAFYVPRVYQIELGDRCEVPGCTCAGFDPAKGEAS